jgi:AraC-like DNA-binding protein
MHYPMGMGIIREGTIRREFPGYFTDCGPGQVYLTGAWEPHGWTVLHKTCTLIHVGFFPEFIFDTRFPEAPEFVPMDLFTAPPDRRPQLPRDGRGPMVRLAEQMLEVQQSERPRKTLWLRSLLLQGLLLLYERWDPPASNSAAAAAAKAADPAPASPLNPAIQLVLRSRRFLSVTEAASACGLSPKTFAGSFARLMGVSFPRFALRYRFQAAARQLLNSDGAIKTVAAQWGFTDASHLHRCFMEHFGCTPSDYRRRSTFALPSPPAKSQHPGCA